MNTKKITRDITANSLQVFINQVCGLAVFYVLSNVLSKEDFGALNWCLALLLAIFSILSFGIDQVLIKKIATGRETGKAVSAYTLHVLVTGVSFYVLLLLLNFIFPSLFHAQYYLLLLAIGKLAGFFASPFKQLAIGLERFDALLWMNSMANIVRALFIFITAYNGNISIEMTILFFIIADTIEFIVCIGFAQRIQLRFTLNNVKQYHQMILKEALPQLGVVIFSSALARMDWILLGILAGNRVLADYSFAYKVFEVVTLPLSVIAPLLMRPFCRIFKNKFTVVPSIGKQMILLIKVEMILAGMTMILLNLYWEPLIDPLTNGHYGAVNSNTILILSAAIPFLYINNFLWTINFAQNRLKMIFLVFLACFLFNFAGNFSLIPFFGAEAAAACYTVTMLLQCCLYLHHTALKGSTKTTLVSFIAPVAAMIIVVINRIFFELNWLVMLASVSVYFFLLWSSRQFKDYLSFTVRKPAKV